MGRFFAMPPRKRPRPYRTPPSFPFSRGVAGVLCNVSRVMSSSCSHPSPVKHLSSVSKKSMGDGPVGVLGEQGLETRKAEHLAPGVMRLHQAVGVEQDVFIAGEDHFLLLIAHD